MKKLLLIGKDGQVGSELEKTAKEFGFAITSFGRSELDITDYKAIAHKLKSHKPDVVINASAYHVVSECETNPEEAFLINAVALKNLSETCERYNSMLVHYSTDYVFDGLKGKPYTENDKPSPLQIYGISKLSGENIVLNYSRGGIVIRSCGIYGGKIGSRAKKGNFVLTILKQIQGKKELEVASEQIVSPTYAKDLARATFQLLHKKSHGVYHLVNDGHCSWAEFAKEIVLRVKGSTRIIPIDRSGTSGGAKRPLFSALKCVRAKSLGVTLPTWQDALKRYIQEL